jgi:hypothetical protein
LKDLKHPRAAIGDDGEGDQEGDAAAEGAADAGDEAGKRRKGKRRKFTFKKEAKKRTSGQALSPNLEDQFAAFKKAVLTSAKV